MIDMEQATQWHNRPKGFKGRCPVCGLPTTARGEHRAVGPQEPIDAVWIVRQRSGLGWVQRAIGAKRVAAAVRDREHRARRRQVVMPRDETVSRIRQATTMLANGATMAEAAKALGIALGALEATEDHNRGIWRQMYDEVMLAQVTICRKQAGTDDALADPQAHWRRARRAERWAKANGIELFESNGEMTLGRFFAEVFMPQRLADVRPATVQMYEMCLRQWRLLMGDPPLRAITSAMMADFRNALGKLPGMGVGYASPNSVRKTLRHVQTVLDKCGKPGPRNRDAAGLLDTVPWAKPPKEVLRLPKVVTPDVLQKAYIACTAMDYPRFDGIRAPAWWRGLLVTVYNTGIRCRTVFALRMEYIDWAHKMLVIPCESMKAGRPHIVPLNEAAMEHLRAMRTERELVFPWPIRLSAFYPAFRQLQRAAGLKPDECFGLHDLRKTLATTLWSVAPEAAILALGHAASSVTMRHYVNAGSVLTEAVKHIPQPWERLQAG